MVADAAPPPPPPPAPDATERRRGLLRRRARHQRAFREHRRIVELLPPEGAPIRFEVAGLGARFGAQLLDLMLTGVALLAFAILVFFVLDLDLGPAGGAIFALLFFAIRTPYYIFSELLMNGRTVGKKISGLRVVSKDGRGLDTHQIVARNLMKEFEVFLPGIYLLSGAQLTWWEGLILALWIGGLILFPLFNRHRQRLGDVIANTYVVVQPMPALLPDLAVSTGVAQAAGRFIFQARHLDHYGAFELQVLERVLQAGEARDAESARQRRENLVAIAERIRRKIAYEEQVAAEEVEDFLRAFYAAQRAYLEQRRLFGDAREDKFHAEERAAAQGRPGGRGDPGAAR